MKNLNIGCGSVFHPDWINVDLVSSHPEVQAYDIRKGLPYPDNTLDACYSSHVLEHLTNQEADQLLKECFRVLRPSGIIRIVVPDLESIARHYLHSLESAQSGDGEADYDWMMLELFDQMVRSKPGGEMLSYLTAPDIKNKAFVRSRMGLIAEKYWTSTNSNYQDSSHSTSLLETLKSRDPSWLIDQFRLNCAKLLVRWVAGKNAEAAFEEGLFRNSGEIHRWMYDDFSLSRLLKRIGFVDICTCQAAESRIPNFSTYNLDTVNGMVRIPQSLFVEVVKP